MADVSTTTHPIPSSNADVLEFNAKKIDEFSSSDNETYTDRGGVDRKTVYGMNQQVNNAIATISGNYIGIHTIGLEFNSYNDYSVYNGVEYRPRSTTTLPYTATSNDPTAEADYLKPWSDELATVAIANNTTVDDVAYLEVGDTYAGQRFLLSASQNVAYHFESGVLGELVSVGLVNDNYIEITTSDGVYEGYSTSIDLTETWIFGSVSDMLGESYNGLYAKLPVGSVVSTGSTTWKIVTSDKGWELGAADGRYALPLNGVYLTDLGADPEEGNDASDAFDLALANYNVSTKARFAIVLNGGKFNVSRQIALGVHHSRLKISGGLATITATSDMDSVITWPNTSDLEIKDIIFNLGTGVSIADAVVDGGNSGTSDKAIRTKLNNLQGHNVSGAPIFLRMTQEWEFKLENIRVDHDVSGQTGTCIQLRSCVNGQIKTPEVGYSAVGVQFSKSPDVAYSCEGIDLVAPVLTYAAIGLKGDNVTALNAYGGVLDFCLTRAWEFTNGSDVAFFGTWFANRSDSGASGTLGISQPTFDSIKLVGCHFVNNHPTNAWNALSLNSPSCKVTDNTSSGQLSTGIVLSDAQISGNDFIDSSRNQCVTAVQKAPAGSGNAAVTRVESGETDNAADKLLTSYIFSAPQINASTIFSIDTFRGATADQIYAQFGWNGAYKFKFDMAAGDIRILSAGRGIVLTSPDGSTTKLLRLSNAGALELL